MFANKTRDIKALKSNQDMKKKNYKNLTNPSMMIYIYKYHKKNSYYSTF